VITLGSLPKLISNTRDSHVIKTGEIKDLVITEESGIAKGTRRITAVTGHEAADVERIAGDLRAELATILHLKGKEKDNAMKQFSVKINQADISVLRKAEIKDQLAKSQKAFIEENKAREKAANKAAMDGFNRHFKTNPTAESYFASVDVDGNLKSLLLVVGQARKMKKAVYLFSMDPDGSKIAHVNYVPEHQLKDGFDAKLWAKAVTEVIGGKAGGQTDSVQGVGVNVEKLKEALEVAEKTYRSPSKR